MGGGDSDGEKPKKALRPHPSSSSGNDAQGAQCAGEKKRTLRAHPRMLKKSGGAAEGNGGNGDDGDGGDSSSTGTGDEKTSRRPPMLKKRDDSGLRGAVLAFHNNIMNTWGGKKTREPTMTHVYPDDAPGIAVDTALRVWREQMQKRGLPAILTPAVDERLSGIVSHVLESGLEDSIEEVSETIPDPAEVDRRDRQKLELTKKRMQEKGSEREEQRNKRAAEKEARRLRMEEKKAALAAAEKAAREEESAEASKEAKEPSGQTESGGSDAVTDCVKTEGGEGGEKKKKKKRRDKDKDRDKDRDKDEKSRKEKKKKKKDEDGKEKKKKRREDKGHKEKEKDKEKDEVTERDDSNEADLAKASDEDKAERKQSEEESSPEADNDKDSDSRDDSSKEVTMSTAVNGGESPEEAKEASGGGAPVAERQAAMKRANSGRHRQRTLVGMGGSKSSPQASKERQERIIQMNAPLPMITVVEKLIPIETIESAVRAAILEAFPDEDDACSTTADDPEPVCVCFHESLRGRRPQNEDHYTAMETCNSLLGISAAEHGLVSYFGMYDGHNGQHGAVYTRQHLHHHIARHDEFPENMEKAIFDGFLSTDKRVNDWQLRKGCSNGTTAICAWLFARDGAKELVVGNTGDSQGVLARGSECVLLSRSHSPTDPQEQERLKDAGAAVIYFGTWRVNGVLAVSRSIGDCDLRFAVVADPEVTRFQISDEDKFFILATDGLWDVMKFDESIKFVNDVLEEKGRSACALELCEEALRRGSNDNVSVIVVFFC